MHRPSPHAPPPTSTASTRTRWVTALLAGLLLLAGCSSPDPGPTVVPDEGASQSGPAPTPTSSEPPEQTAEDTAEDTAEESTAELTTSEETAGETSAGPTGSDGTATEGAGSVSEVIMCTGATFDEDRSVCPAAEDMVETSSLHCSGTLTATKAGDIDVVFARDGAPIQTFQVPLTPEEVGTAVPFDADTSVGELLVPSGEWSCQITLPGGATNQATMQVQGPDGAFSQGRACASTDTLVTEFLTHCLTDETALSSDLPSITCSALLTGVDGEDITVSLVVNGETTPVGTITAPLGMIVAHLNLEPIAFGGPTFPPGDYSCVFDSPTEASGRHDFTVVE